MRRSVRASGCCPLRRNFLNKEVTVLRAASILPARKLIGLILDVYRLTCQAEALALPLPGLNPTSRGRRVVGLTAIDPECRCKVMACSAGLTNAVPCVGFPVGESLRSRLTPLSSFSLGPWVSRSLDTTAGARPRLRVCQGGITSTLTEGSIVLCTGLLLCAIGTDSDSIINQR